jgi:hypothetical protein
MANVTLTNITPPRVPLLDPRTGLITREWYRFFFSLFTLTGGGQNTTSLTDLQLGPPAPTQENITEIVVDIESLKTQPTQESALDQIAELQKQIQALELQPAASQGTVTAVTGTAPVVSSGGTAPDISMAAANTTTNGYLTSTDWNTFNSKGSGTVTAVSVATANGLAGTSSGGATPALTLSTTVAGLLKGNGTAISAAVAGTDYLAPSAPVTKTANFTVAAGETWLINNKSGSSCVVTLPTPSTNTGRELNFQNYQAQTLVSASSNVVPLAGGSAGTAILQAVAGANATLVSDGTSWIMTKYDSNNSLELE